MFCLKNLYMYVSHTVQLNKKKYSSYLSQNLFQPHSHKLYKLEKKTEEVIEELCILISLFINYLYNNNMLILYVSAILWRAI